MHTNIIHAYMHTSIIHAYTPQAILHHTHTHTHTYIHTYTHTYMYIHGTQVGDDCLIILPAIPLEETRLPQPLKSFAILLSWLFDEEKRDKAANEALTHFIPKPGSYVYSCVYMCLYSVRIGVICIHVYVCACMWCIWTK